MRATTPNYVKFNIVAELRKVLAGKPSKVSRTTLLQLTAPAYLKSRTGKE
jgi:hypothetical protein